MSLFISFTDTPPPRSFGDVRQLFASFPNDMPVQWQTDSAVLVSTVSGILETWASVPGDTPFPYAVEYSGSGWGFDIYGHVSKLDG